jgi:hypothetical protein
MHCVMEGFLRARPWEINQDASKAVSSEYIGI